MPQMQASNIQDMHTMAQLQGAHNTSYTPAMATAGHVSLLQALYKDGLTETQPQPTQFETLLAQSANGVVGMQQLLARMIHTIEAQAEQQAQANQKHQQSMERIEQALTVKASRAGPIRTRQQRSKTADGQDTSDDSEDGEEDGDEHDEDEAKERAQRNMDIEVSGSDG
jgi:hypothetical protein